MKESFIFLEAREIFFYLLKGFETSGSVFYVRRPQDLSALSVVELKQQKV